MVGLGETKEEVRALLLDLFDQGCKIVTIGQYLRPSLAHYPVRRFVTPEEFEQWEEEALNMGFAAVASGPFVRSSFKAQGLYEKAALVRRINDELVKSQSRPLSVIPAKAGIQEY